MCALNSTRLDSTPLRSPIAHSRRSMLASNILMIRTKSRWNEFVIYVVNARTNIFQINKQGQVGDTGPAEPR